MGYGSIAPSGGGERSIRTGVRAVVAATAFLAVASVIAVVSLSGQEGTVRGPLSMLQTAKAKAPVKYTYIPAQQLAAQPPVQYVPVQYLPQAPAPKAAAAAAAPQVQYVPITAAQYQAMQAQHASALMPTTGAPQLVQRFAGAIGGKGVYKAGHQLADEEPAGDAGDAAGNSTDTEAEDEMPEEMTPPTPDEIAKALQRIQERQIQQQTYHDTLVDAQTGQPLHVPGVAGSAHNGVSGIGGVFGVGGFLGPDYPIADSVQPSGAVSEGPACTCSSCTGSPPVCTGCTCR